jgi:hypothetical protein
MTKTKKMTKTEMAEELLIKSGYFRPDQVKEILREHLRERRRDIAQEDDEAT